MSISTSLKALGATALIGLGLAGTAQADSSAHSVRACDHSAMVSGHAASADTSGAASVVAVPAITVGSGFALLGAALNEVGQVASEFGNQIYIDAKKPLVPIQLGPVAGPAPSLD